MSKVLRFLSTLMILAGLGFLVIYVRSQNTAAAGILDHPSYYAEKNMWLMFLAGIAVVAFSVLGSFFSWFKKGFTTIIYY